MNELVVQINKLLNNKSFDLSNEKKLQELLEKTFLPLNLNREHRLSSKHIVDFFKDGLAIEVKTKGSAQAIFRQCKKYCEYEEVKGLLLISAKFMGFPKEINSKPTYFIHLSKNFL